MQLKEYLFISNVKLAAFARLIGVPYHKMYYVYRGGCPHLGVAKKIIDGSNGLVTMECLLQNSKAPW